MKIRSAFAVVLLVMSLVLVAPATRASALDSGSGTCWASIPSDALPAAASTDTTSAAFCDAIYHYMMANCANKYMQDGDEDQYTKCKQGANSWKNVCEIVAQFIGLG